MSIWHKPNREQLARGFVAMLETVAYCEVNSGLIAVSFYGGYQDKATKKHIPKRPILMGYTRAMLERRAKRSEDVPQWASE